MNDEILEACIKLLRATERAMPSYEADIVVHSVANILEQLIEKKP